MKELLNPGVLYNILFPGMCFTFLPLIITDFRCVYKDIILNNYYSDEFTSHPEASIAWRRTPWTSAYYNTSGHTFFKKGEEIICRKDSLYSENLCPLRYNAVSIGHRYRRFGAACCIANYVRKYIPMDTISYARRPL